MRSSAQVLLLQRMFLPAQSFEEIRQLLAVVLSQDGNDRAIFRYAPS